MNTRFFTYLSTTVMLAASLAHCGSSSAPNTSMAASGGNTSAIDANSVLPPGPVADANTITEQDANTTVTRAKGTPVIVSLVQHSDGGYSWSADVTNLGTPTTSQAADPNGLLGAPTRAIFTWDTAHTAPGTYPLNFTEARSFDPNDAPNHFSVTITITP